MSNLSQVFLGDICQLKAGNAFPKERQGISEGDLPFIKVSDFELPGNERKITRANNYLSCDVASELRVKKHRSGGVAFAKIGIALTYNRRRLLTRDTVVDNNLMVAEANQEVCDDLYFYYLLKTIDFNLIANGSAIPYLNASDIRSIGVAIHPAREQKVIAHILGTLDDKIELNRRTTETLEATAMALFKSWFVDFDPVRAKAEGRPTGLPADISDLFPDSFDDSELGAIPSGWSIAPLSDIAQISTGKRPAIVVNSRSTLNPIPVYGGAGVMGYTCDALTGCEPVLVTGRVGTLGVIHRVLEKAWISDNALIVNPGEIRFLYAYHFLLGQDLKALNRGSTQPLLSQSDLKSLPVARPPEALFGVFHELTQHCQARQSLLFGENVKANALLDSLIPKLISGEIRIHDAEKMLEEVGV